MTNAMLKTPPYKWGRDEARLRRYRPLTRVCSRDLILPKNSISCCSIVLQRSSPSRARFARACGALLTAPVRCKQRLAAKRKWNLLTWYLARAKKPSNQVANRIPGLVRCWRAKLGDSSKASRLPGRCTEISVRDNSREHSGSN